jgi:adenosylcobinamide-phosphate synthase
MSFAGLMLTALVIEAAMGWPKWLHARIAHPVVWLGGLIAILDRTLNRLQWPHVVRYGSGAASTVLVIAVATGAAWAIASLTAPSALGFAIEAIVAASLVAGRNLYDHVAAVAAPLAGGDLAGARARVAMIAGRDPAALNEAGVARAALESLAENASDGVVAPVFWGVLFGLPGVAAYKAINTLDSMIGHRTPRHQAFGGFAARLDDLANLLPARITGMLFGVVSGHIRALEVMLRDGAKHRSPNAGWPEAAMAGALGVRLSGPRMYDGVAKNEPWLNAGALDPDAKALKNGLRLYLRAMAAMALTLAAMSVAL